jgi:hypothetical protein
MKIAIVLALGALVLACSSGTTGGDATGHDAAVPDTSATDTATPADVDDTTPADVAVPDADDDTWIDASVDVSVDADPDTVPDTAPDVPFFDPCQGPGQPGALPVGAPCTSHDDCLTGYCYDEAWKDTPENGGFRFCTIGCSSCAKSCSDWGSLTAAGGSCVLFLAAESNEHDLQYRSICMPKCQTDADCTGASGGLLTTCRAPLHFDGSAIGLQKSCFPQ